MIELKQPPVDLPDEPPPSFAPRISNWPRDGLLLATIAGGVSLQVELQETAAAEWGISAQAGSTKERIARLERVGLVERWTHAMHLGGGGRRPVRLTAVRLTEPGRELAQACGWPAKENDFDRLLRLHDGARQPDHTAAVLLFVRQVRRRRRWTVAVCPEFDDPAGFIPDVEIDPHWDDCYCVEVERGRGKPAKWRLAASCNMGRQVYVCAMNPQRRRTLVAEIRALGLPVMATDLRTLMRYRSAPLWLEGRGLPWGEADFDTSVEELEGLSSGEAAVAPSWAD